MDETRIDGMDDETRRSRRLVLRSLLGLAAAGATLTGLAACGGEGGDDEEEDEEEEDD